MKSIQESICSASVWLVLVDLFFHDRSFNHKIKRLHKRLLRIVYKNGILLFEELLFCARSVTTYQNNADTCHTNI